jgi:tripartite-type tricarboxylate transporter receptor subunit TctC
VPAPRDYSPYRPAPKYDLGLTRLRRQAPAGTPQPAIDRLSGAMVAALQTPAVREKRLGLGIQPTGATSERIAAIVAADAARWRAIVTATGFSVE